eukprot:comp23838_c0_seq1/m.41612 comp23838_c0_seq1/g.41612  ORF comp23838_c0_seq1/g.41612 comp23838_c0_seq1/m.41612 type:complete len:359 (-) comp23838_c0_seq1:146-1222(-)
MKKTFGKVSQWTGEKLGKFEQTKLEQEFVELEKKTDATDDVVKKLMTRAEEYLQPNPTARAKLKMINATGKAEKRYPQPEGELADAMVKGSIALGDGSSFGHALQRVGDAENQIAEARHALDSQVMQAFIKPLSDFHNQEVKEVMSNRKKLESRRLEYDLKKRALEKKPGDPKAEGEFQVAESKFEEQKELVFNGMASLLESDVEQVGQLVAFVEAQLEFYRTALSILEPTLNEVRGSIGSGGRQHIERYQKRVSTDGPTSYDSRRMSRTSSQSHGGSGGYISAPIQSSATVASASMASGGGKTYIRALYDFNAESAQELTFRKGDRLELVQQLDENWMEGSINGRTGIFPCSYVERV